jgi:hypothetical protein
MFPPLVFQYTRKTVPVHKEFLVVAECLSFLFFFAPLGYGTGRESISRGVPNIYPMSDVQYHYYSDGLLRGFILHLLSPYDCVQYWDCMWSMMNKIDVPTVNGLW